MSSLIRGIFFLHIAEFLELGLRSNSNKIELNEIKLNWIRCYLNSFQHHHFTSLAYQDFYLKLAFSNHYFFAFPKFPEVICICI